MQVTCRDFLLKIIKYHTKKTVDFIEYNTIKDQRTQFIDNVILTIKRVQ